MPHDLHHVQAVVHETPAVEVDGDFSLKGTKPRFGIVETGIRIVPVLDRPG